MGRQDLNLQPLDPRPAPTPGQHLIDEWLAVLLQNSMALSVGCKRLTGRIIYTFAYTRRV
jgi:hypothetical protein